MKDKLSVILDDIQLFSTFESFFQIQLIPLSHVIYF